MMVKLPVSVFATDTIVATVVVAIGALMVSCSFGRYEHHSLVLSVAALTNICIARP